jgi:hypothetical protein
MLTGTGPDALNSPVVGPELPRTNTAVIELADVRLAHEEGVLCIGRATGLPGILWSDPPSTGQERPGL